MLPALRRTARFHRLFASDAICTGPGDRIYLTFDDGPHPEATPRVLDILHNHGIQGTFFCTGTGAETHPDIVQRIVFEGHELGSHGYAHERLVFRGSAAILESIQRTDEAFRHACGREATLFRPPYGAYGPTLLRILRGMGKRLVLWSLDTRDFERAEKTEFATQTAALVQPGDILLLHDNRQTSPYLLRYLPELISIMSAQGRTFRILSS